MTQKEFTQVVLTYDFNKIQEAAKTLNYSNWSAENRAIYAKKLFNKGCSLMHGVPTIGAVRVDSPNHRIGKFLVDLSNSISR